MGSDIVHVILVIGLMTTMLRDCHGRRAPMQSYDDEISNEVIVEFETLPGGRRIDYIIESNSIPDETRPPPTDEAVVKEMATRLTNDGYDPYFVGDLRLTVPSKNIYNDDSIRADVLLDQGMVVGLSDFRHHSDAVKKRHHPKTPVLHLLLIWSRLRVHYRVTVDRGGLKNVGQLDMRVSRLFMDVLLTSDSDVPRIQMSKVTEVGSKVTGLDALPDDLKTSVAAEAESMVRTFFNTRVIGVLLRYMEGVLNANPDENMLASFYSA